MRTDSVIFSVLATALALERPITVQGFVTAPKSPYATALSAADDGEDQAERLRKQAEELREQIRSMEAQLGGERPRNYEQPPQPKTQPSAPTGPSLRNKRVLVAGANGRLGSMVCRYLLRNHPNTEVVACVHYVGENSMTSRGYGRLSYEVGAEDGVGNIGAAWSAERTATFEYDSDLMKDYNLQNLRLVECELLDPTQCQTICEGVDSIIWCATDFNGNTPRAVSGLNVAFLFRALADPLKPRVEIEGLRNLLGGLKTAKQDRRWKSQFGSEPTASSSPDENTNEMDDGEPANFVLVSTAPDVYPDFETPFGTFHGLKREGEDLLRNEFPSLSHTILQMGRYDDNFVEEGKEIMREDVAKIPSEDGDGQKRSKRRINRRDAARFAVEALLDPTAKGKAFQVWSDPI